LPRASGEKGDPTRPQTLVPALRSVEAVFISPGVLGDATAGTATVELLIGTDKNATKSKQEER